MYDGYLQNVDQLNRRLQTSFNQVLQTKQQQLLVVNGRLQQHQPQMRLQQAQRDVTRLHQQLTQTMQRYLQAKQQTVQQQIQSLDYLSPLKIMGRGYSYVTDDTGNVLKKAQDFKPDKKIDLHVTDAIVAAKVVKVKPQDKK